MKPVRCGTRVGFRLRGLAWRSSYCRPLPQAGHGSRSQLQNGWPISGPRPVPVCPTGPPRLTTRPIADASRYVTCAGDHAARAARRFMPSCSPTMHRSAFPNPESSPHRLRRLDLECHWRPQPTAETGCRGVVGHQALAQRMAAPLYQRSHRPYGPGLRSVRGRRCSVRWSPRRFPSLTVSFCSWLASPAIRKREK
jgi:hypothetical protein